jgi:hypothetical protein
MKITLPLFTKHGWIEVEAELLPVEHLWPWTFAVHRHLLLPQLFSNTHFSVTHVESGLSVIAFVEGKDAAIEAALQILHDQTREKMALALLLNAPQECIQ